VCAQGIYNSSFTTTLRPNPKCIQHLQTGTLTSGKGLAIKHTKADLQRCCQVRKVAECC